MRILVVAVYPCTAKNEFWSPVPRVTWAPTMPGFVQRRYFNNLKLLLPLLILETGARTDPALATVC
jgi:hypothetical protein